MEKFSVDFNHLQTKLSQKKAFRLHDVRDRLEKVAFDVVRFVDSNIDELWQIKSDGDQEYIVALYDGEPLTVSSEWSALPESTKQAVNVFYKNSPIKRLAISDFGLEPEDINSICRFLPKKLASDAGFRQSFLKSLSKSEMVTLQEENPSFASEIK